MDGQISILDYIDKEMNICIPKSEDKPPILLNSGDIVYKVIRGDVEEYYVYDEKSWLCGEGERGYRLKQQGGCYGCCWNNSIGSNVFIKYEDALKVANRYLENNECIRKEDIVPLKTVAFSYVRQLDNKELIAFYTELEDGYLYIKDFITYHHMCKKEKSVINDFMAQIELNNATKVEFTPIFKNMYPVKDKNDTWKYCEARCNK